MGGFEAMGLTLILGNQLHPEWLTAAPLQLNSSSRVLMVEDLGLASRFRYHKLRLLHCFVAMRAFREALRAAAIPVRYFELGDSIGLSFWERLKQELALAAADGFVPELRIAEMPDPGVQAELAAFCQERHVALVVLPSPAFLASAAESRADFEGQRRPFMKTFYERQRRRLNLLIEADGSPSGGRWSFDADNRKKLPKGYKEPPLPQVSPSAEEPAVRALIETHFPQNPGQLGSLVVPFDHAGASAWLDQFLAVRLHDFGPYEDALSSSDDVLQHSLLAPLLNIGLLSPATVVRQTLAQAAVAATPIASLEGFLRQVVGWREFVRGIDLVHGERQARGNFWGHQRRLAPCWNAGDTGLPPLDRAIERLNRLAWNHHIERLMVISNLMLLCEIHPGEVYGWFMERYIDSYPWVMGPNVYGMGQMSDGGIFATKPYICGSNYILKMGDFKKGPWCVIWDGLYWRFIDRHREFFAANPRLSMMVRLLDRIDPERRQMLADAAESFLERATMVEP
jgi:deoxyribodipyrimidine photolyase-related protein